MPAREGRREREQREKEMKGGGGDEVRGEARCGVGGSTFPEEFLVVTLSDRSHGRVRDREGTPLIQLINQPHMEQN